MKKFVLPMLATLVLIGSGGWLSADEAALKEAMQAYVDAFNKRDMDQVKAMWSEQAVHTDLETGTRVVGREAIAADIAAAFETMPGIVLSGTVERIRLVTPEVAKVEGQTSITTPDRDVVYSSFTALFVNDDGNWMIDSLDEGILASPPSSYEALRGLEWMVGSWVDESEDQRVEASVRWTANQAFLIRSFSITADDDATLEGTEVIGWDARSKEIRSWTFNSDGSFGDGIWSKNGDGYLVKSSQTLADGNAASGTFVIKRVDPNTLTVQLVAHEIEGEPQPASETATVVRVEETAQPEPASSNE